MNIAIIDAEIIGKNKHRFPNLCSMKIAAYHKQNGDSVQLKTDYEDLQLFDRVYISKVFVRTIIPGEPEDQSGKNEQTVREWYENNQFLKQDNIVYGGTGFFYDKAPPLPPEIEHIMPDYHLYDDWVNTALDKGGGEKRSDFSHYLDYSIGYLTRRCFRGCAFCVNKNYKGVVAGSPLSEFMDESRPKLCFLDDNFLGYPKWGELIGEVIKTKKKFKFKQGLDERLLTKDKVLSMKQWRYDGYLTFAFDNIDDKEMIVSKLKLIRETAPDWKKYMTFYVLCGFDREDRYDLEFWKKDIRDVFERISILSSFGVLPYVMRHEQIKHSDFSSFYSNVAAWCNQPSFFKTRTFSDFCIERGKIKNGKGASWRELERISSILPDVASKYFNFVGMKNRREES